MLLFLHDCFSEDIYGCVERVRDSSGSRQPRRYEQARTTSV
ncbi:MAG: hypothetical protein PW786_03775 [Arachidicoccus sp.]|nr:hypothetical protein [Arachidicoccus sp.]